MRLLALAFQALPDALALLVSCRLVRHGHRPAGAAWLAQVILFGPGRAQLFALALLAGFSILRVIWYGYRPAGAAWLAQVILFGLGRAQPFALALQALPDALEIS